MSGLGEAVGCSDCQNTYVQYIPPARLRIVQGRDHSDSLSWIGPAAVGVIVDGGSGAEEAVKGLGRRPQGLRGLEDPLGRK